MDADSPDEPFRLTDDDPLSGLAKWLAEGTVDAAAAARARQRWLERQAAEDASLPGVLLDLGERGRRVAIRTAGTTSVAGFVVAMGADFVVVREDRLGDVVIPLTALATVRGAPGDDPAVGDRSVALSVVLGEALVELAIERPLVRVAAGGDDVRGELRSAGRDVIAIATESSPRAIVHVALAAIDHLVLTAG